MTKWMLRFESHLTLTLMVLALVGVLGAMFHIGFMVLSIGSIFAWFVLLEICIQEFIRSHQDF